MNFKKHDGYYYKSLHLTIKNVVVQGDHRDVVLLSNKRGVFTVYDTDGYGQNNRKVFTSAYRAAQYFKKLELDLYEIKWG